MPVLMNKGTDPRQAAWLFYTDCIALEEFAEEANERRFDAGFLTVDEDELGRAKKASSEVTVYLEVETLVPEDFDLSSIGVAAEEGEGEAAEEAAGEGAEGEGAGSEEAPGGEAAPEGDGESGLPYEPVPAPERIRVAIGVTTASNARAYLCRDEADAGDGGGDGKDARDTRLPGLPALVSFVNLMLEHGGIQPYMVWHVDQDGILRMSGAKQVKPMAGNILKCKL